MARKIRLVSEVVRNMEAFGFMGDGYGESSLLLFFDGIVRGKAFTKVVVNTTGEAFQAIDLNGNVASSSSHFLMDEDWYRALVSAIYIEELE